jgi:hypothetical protein
MTLGFFLLYFHNSPSLVNNFELYNFTLWIASSPAKFKNETVKAIEKFLKLYVVETVLPLAGSKAKAGQ